MKIPLFDAHCDTALIMMEQGRGLMQNDCHVDLERALQLEKYAQFFAIWGVPKYVKDMPYTEIFDRVYDCLITELTENSDIISVCKNAQELDLATEAGKMAAFISLEGADLIDCSLDGLERAYEKGVRAVTITWNYENRLSGTNVSGGGLTEQGREFVIRMQELGMLVDVSHISDEAFWDIMDITSAPVVATHSNSRSVWYHSRNLTDDMFRHITGTGGVAGINLYTEFLGGEGTDIDHVIDHIEHFLNLGGEKSLAIGCDFDGCDSLPAGICGIEDLHKLYQALLLKGYKKELIDDIFYYNMLGAVRRGVK